MNKDKRYFHYYFHEERQEHIKVYYDSIDDAELLTIDPNNEKYRLKSGAVAFQNNEDYLDLFLRSHYDFLETVNENTYLVRPKENREPQEYKFHSSVKIDHVFEFQKRFYTNNNLQVIVFYFKEESLALIDNIIQQQEGSYVKHQLGNILLVTFSSIQKANQGLDALQLRGICYAELNLGKFNMLGNNTLNRDNNYENTPIEISDNEIFSLCNTIHKERLLGKSNIKIAVIDDGIFEHKCLQGVIDKDLSFDFYGNSNSLHNNDWHGTACAGIIAAKKSGNYGMYGIAAGCDLVALKFKRGNGSTLWSLIQALLWCVEKDISVINCSFDITEKLERSQVFKEVLRKIAKEGRGNAGLPIVFSAGNTHSELTDIKRIKEIIVVAAVKQDFNPIPSSCYGNNVFISAYGENVLTLDYPGPNKKDILTYTNPRHNDFGYFSLTSAAAPIVAGGIALLLSQNSGLELIEIKKKIKASVHPNSRRNNFGAGVFSLEKLINNM